MTLETLFERIGLSPLAARVYEALEKGPPKLVTEISAATGLHRPTVYRELAALKKAALIETERRGKRTAYAAAPRSRVLALYRGESTKTERLAKGGITEERLPKGLRHLTGASGIRAAFDDVIEHTKRGGVFYRYTSERDLDEVNAYLSPGYRTARDKKRLERLVISNAGSGKKKRSRLERFVKFMPDETFEQDVIELVYGERVSFIDLARKDVLIIENSALAAFEKAKFRELYRRLA